MNPIESKLKELNAIHLPDARKRLMREELIAYATLHSVAPAPAARALSRFQFRIYSALAAVLVLIVGVGGTAYASEDALPGDALYSVKVNISEPIQTALVPSEKGKAAWHAILAERRLEEAAQLAAKGTLTPDTQEELAANFNEQVDASDENADRLEQHGDMLGSLSVRSDLDARLTAHEQILGVIAAHYEKATSTEASSTGRAVSSLLAIVQASEADVSASRHAIELALAPEATSSSEESRTVSVAIADGATTTAKVAITTEHAFAPAPKARLMRAIAPEASSADRIADQVESQNVSQAQEVSAILTKHASLLAMFLPSATTTASTTLEASTTASTTDGTASSTETTDDASDDGAKKDAGDGDSGSDAVQTVQDVLKDILE